MASNILPGQRYDPVQQHPDDNSSISSAELLINNQSNDQDNTNQREHDDSANEPAELNNGEPTGFLRGEEMPELFAPTVEMITRQEKQTDPLMDERPMTQSRTRRFQMRIRDIRVMLFSTVSSRLLLPLISVLYYLMFSPMVMMNNATYQGLTALSMMLLSYHKVQSIRTLRTLTLTPTFSKMMRFDKSFCWLWLMLYIIAYIIELVIFIDSWFSFSGEHFSYVVQAVGVLSFIIGICSGMTYSIVESILGRNQTPSLLFATRTIFFVSGPSFFVTCIIHSYVICMETARGLTLFSLLWFPTVWPDGMYV